MRKLRDLLKYLALVYLIVEWWVIFPSLIHLLLSERESKGMRMNFLLDLFIYCTGPIGVFNPIGIALVEFGTP